MISIAETRALLGPLAAGKSDAELEAMRQRMYASAGQLIAAFKRGRGASGSAPEPRREKRKARR